MRKMYSKKQVEDIVLESLENADEVVVGGDLEVTGDIKYLENIVDNAGNKRFIEGNVNVPTLEGVTFSYAKWSLSGSHLMIVIAFKIDNETSILSSQQIGEVSIPSWIGNKIYELLPPSAVVAIDSFVGRISGDKADHSFELDKVSSQSLIVYPYGTLTATADTGFRIEFDLLIDND